MSGAFRDLNLEHLWVIYPGQQEYALDRNISVIPINTVLEIPNRLP